MSVRCFLLNIFRSTENRLRTSYRKSILRSVTPVHMTVERVSYIHEDELMGFMGEIKHTFRPDRQEDAQFIQGAVSAIRRNPVDAYTYNEAERTAIASIQNDETYTIRLVFEEKKIICSCGQPGWCVHQVIVIFHLYLQYHSLTDWIGEWRRMETEQLKLEISERTPEAWNETLSQLMNPIRIIGFNENPAIFIHKFSLINQKSFSLSPFEWEWKPIFELYYRLHALDAAWPYIYYHLGDSENSFSYGKWYVKNWLTEQFEKIEDATESLSSKPQLFELDPFYDDLRNFIRSFALEKEGLFTERFRLYRTCWLSLFQHKSMREAEQSILSERDTSEAYPLLAFFHIIEKNYSELEQMATHITDDRFSQWFSLTDIAEYEDDSESLSIIMHALLPFIREHLTKSVARSKREVFVRRLDGLFESAHFSEEERENMFPYYGSAGVYVYADFLIERERFKEWAALMHRYRVSYEIVEASGLKLALRDDPAAVLPLLHLYALNFIAERNRQSYRRAVNVFRKMKNGAKKSGKHDFWNQYVETIQEKNRRLRALMEEMEKGNLKL